MLSALVLLQQTCWAQFYSFDAIFSLRPGGPPPWVREGLTLDELGTIAMLVNARVRCG